MDWLRGIMHSVSLTPQQPCRLSQPPEIFNLLQCSAVAPITIDVRAKADYKAGHIFRAINVDMRSPAALSLKLTELSRKCSRDDLVVFQRRTAMVPVILYGYEPPTEEEQELEPALARCLHLYNLLVQEEPRQVVYILEAGYTAFEERFSFLADTGLGRFPHLIDRERYPREVTQDSLYLGGLREVMDATNMIDLGVTHVVSLGKTEEFLGLDKHISHLAWVVSQEEDTKKIHVLFDEVCEFITKAKEKQRRLRGRPPACFVVHDRYGFDVAPTVVIACLMKLDQLTLQDAYDKILRLDYRISISATLLSKLRSYEETVHGHSTFSSLKAVKKRVLAESAPHL